MYMWLYAMYATAPAASVRAKYGERRTFAKSGWLATPASSQPAHGRRRGEAATEPGASVQARSVTLPAHETRHETRADPTFRAKPRAELRQRDRFAARHLICAAARGSASRGDRGDPGHRHDHHADARPTGASSAARAGRSRRPACRTSRTARRARRPAPPGRTRRPRSSRGCRGCRRRPRPGPATARCGCPPGSRRGAGTAASPARRRADEEEAPVGAELVRRPARRGRARGPRSATPPTASHDAGPRYRLPGPSGGADQHDAETATSSSRPSARLGRSPNRIAITAAAAPSQETIGVTTDTGHRAKAL